jgi:hypothetical protein
MKLTANQIRAIYRAIADLYGMINTERINQGGEPEDDIVYNELNAAFASLQAALENNNLRLLQNV